MTTAPDKTPPHFVDTAPFDPFVVEKLTPEQERYFQAGQWQIIWWRFRRHKLAMASTLILALCTATLVLLGAAAAIYRLMQPQLRLLRPAPLTLLIFNLVLPRSQAQCPPPAPRAVPSLSLAHRP